MILVLALLWNAWPLVAVEAQSSADRPHPLQTTEGVLAALNSNQRDFFLIDVRTAAEFRQRRIPGSINIPLEELLQRLPTRNFNATIVLVDRFGNRAARAKYALESLGYRRVIIFGKLRDWTGPLAP